MKISLRDPLGTSACYDSSEQDINNLLKSVAKHLIAPTETYDPKTVEETELWVDSVNLTICDYIESAKTKN